MPSEETDKADRSQHTEKKLEGIWYSSERTNTHTFSGKIEILSLELGKYLKKLFQEPDQLCGEFGLVLSMIASAC